MKLINIQWCPFSSCRVCGERELPGEGFSILTRTADTEHKAWRKKQICYRLAKRGNATQAITDVILCSKTKVAPDGFTLAGDINGITVCFKSGPIPHRPPPSIPSNQTVINELENNLYYMNISNASNGINANGNAKTAHGNNNDYEMIRTSYQLTPPPRTAPIPPRPAPAGKLSKKKNLFCENTHFEWSNICLLCSSYEYWNLGSSYGNGWRTFRSKSNFINFSSWTVWCKLLTWKKKNYWKMNFSTFTLTHFRFV